MGFRLIVQRYALTSLISFQTSFYGQKKLKIKLELNCEGQMIY